MRAAVPLGSAALICAGWGWSVPACATVLPGLDGVGAQLMSGTQREGTDTQRGEEKAYCSPA